MEGVFLRELRKSSYASVRRLFPYLKPYRFWVMVRLLSTVLNAVNDIYLVYLLNQLVDFSLTGDKDQLLKTISLMGCFVVFGIIANLLESYSSGRFSAYTVRDMKDKLSDHMNRLPVSYLETHHSGDLVSRMTNGMNSIHDFLKNDLVGILFHFIRLILCVIVMLFLNWQLTLYIMIILPIMFILTNIVNRPLIKYSSKLQQSIAATYSIVQDTLNGIHVIRPYNLIRAIEKKFDAVLHRLFTDSLAVEKKKAMTGAVNVLAKTWPFLIFFLIGGYFVIYGDFTAGGLVAFAQLINFLVQSLGALPGHINKFSIAAGVTDHLYEVLDEPTERTNGSDYTISKTAPALEFRDVTFSYDGNTKILDNISFALPQGKTIAIVGPSGSGKSTIFKLLTGFYEVQEGDIKLFDHSLSSWKLSSSRKLMSFVSQETFLFPNSIEENIACGKKNYSMDEVYRAAKIANIDQAIESMPDGYQTLVGERGGKLSGGQKQRISIARAIMNNAPIFLLDEATSALDTESEALIQESIHKISLEKSVLIIAHRLSTVVEADEIIVLDKGKIAERGNHKQLLEKKGAYFQLFKKELLGEDDDLLQLRGEVP